MLFICAQRIPYNKGGNEHMYILYMQRQLKIGISSSSNNMTQC